VLVTARQFPGIDETKLIEVQKPITTAPRKLTAVEFEVSLEQERDQKRDPAERAS
jgi:DNA recombination protein RmuC